MITRESWLTNTKLRHESFSLSEQKVVIDQVLLFWREIKVPESEKDLALHYAVTLADAFYEALFLKAEPHSDQTLQELKSLIQSRWGISLKRR